MSEERESKARRVVEGAFNRGEMDGLRDIYAIDCVVHMPPLPDIRGVDAFREGIEDMRNAFSNTQFTFYEMICEGDISAGRWTIEGTHTGQSRTIPVPPTGKQVTILGASVVHWVGDKISEEWAFADWLGLLQQLGVVPPVGQA